ncbi:radical SAM domain protein [Nautilia profundicola AmH]|uniref:Radical SAM domain protein n=1 Tax=Nautilia profundicola (strain ATCC BAA-1463 / DSM 18972 / AmH) TaxID=598659 RepID=B9L8I8_NAUPA|nr:radical SAM protein [Nautilia profundicola]ACM93052.1 radical SAM domain protein [Nautilia profundicola AmH]
MVCYIEENIINHPVTKHIIEKFNPKIIKINHYKDIFNRTHQDFNFQKNKNVLILAEKKEKFLYKGSTFCNSRGYEKFYYSTQILGCVYNCEYCYIGGMYPCGYPVIFVNEDDFISEAEKLKNAYIAISYESDLLAFEGIYPFHYKWIELARKRNDLLIESRTKSANVDRLPDNPPQNFLLGFSLSPVEINRFEKKAPSLEKRIKALKLAITKGYNVEIAIDPIIKTDNFKDVYKNFIEYLKSEIDLCSINIEIGAFRMNKDFLKKLRKIHLSEVVWHPYEIKQGEARYEDEKEIVEYVRGLIVDD